MINFTDLLCNGFQYSGEARLAKPVLWREVCPSHEGLQLWSEEDAHRPPSSSLTGLYERHVHLVHIRSLLSVNLVVYMYRRVEVFNHSLTHTLTHTLTQSLTHTHTHSLNLPLTHSHAQSSNLDGHIVIREKLPDVRVLKRFSLHHMTPVTSGVPHGEKDGLILLPRLLKCFLAPRVPK